MVSDAGKKKDRAPPDIDQQALDAILLQQFLKQDKPYQWTDNKHVVFFPQAPNAPVVIEELQLRYKQYFKDIMKKEQYEKFHDWRVRTHNHLKEIKKLKQSIARNTQLRIFIDNLLEVFRKSYKHDDKPIIYAEMKLLYPGPQIHDMFLEDRAITLASYIANLLEDKYEDRQRIQHFQTDPYVRAIRRRLRRLDR